MVPLDYMFDDHHLCDSNQCFKKLVKEDDTLSVDEKSERMKVAYYMVMEDDEELYEKLYKKHEFYSTEERISQYKHEYDTKISERMNTCVSKYAPKNKHQSNSTSLEARLKTAAGIYSCGYHFFWTELMKVLEGVYLPRVALNIT